MDVTVYMYMYMYVYLRVHVCGHTRLSSYQGLSVSDRRTAIFTLSYLLRHLSTGLLGAFVGYTIDMVKPGLEWVVKLALVKYRLSTNLVLTQY